MELLIRVHHANLREPRDVQIDVDGTRTVGDVAKALLTALGLPSIDAARIVLVRAGTILDPERPMAGSGVVSGDDLVIDPPHAPQRVPAIPIRAVTLDVLSGVDAGTSILLLQGTFSVGRDPTCQVVLRDPTVSRHHVDVDVASDWTVAVRPKEPVENGVILNGQRSDGECRVDDDDIIALGATRVAFRSFVRDPAVRTDQLGQIEFHRTPYRPPMVSERTFPPIADVPKQPEPRRFRMVSAITPLVGGVAMFAFSGQPQFLALTLLSPVAIVGNWIDDKRSGRKKFERDVVKFRQRVADRASEVGAALEAERVERHRAHPDLAGLGRRAELRTADLWARGRAAPDFLVVRLGIGMANSKIHADVERIGEASFREEAAAALVGIDTVRGVPIVVNLAEAGTVGIHGPESTIWGLAGSIVIQATCLHSPEDLVVVAAVGASRPLSQWLRWLPHVRSVTSPLAGRHIVSDEETADELIGRLVEVAQMRTASSEDRVDRRWPWLLAVIDADLRPNPVLLAQLLEAGSAVGISVVWVADSGAQIPRQATEVIDCRPAAASGLGSVWFAESAKQSVSFEVERISSDVADRIARSLAPVRDASAGTETTSIPRTAPLLDVLGIGMPTGAWVAERWMRSAATYGLDFPVGVSATGVLSLDLVTDGPHALIGGTSGAGKSELLQSIVASLASCHSPERLNFLFVDYKGGASSAVFEALPHTVGYVTNLSAELSLRALTSLRAELNRRMQLLEGRAKDIAEMLDRFPDEAPPSLVIIVDEFATLVKEIPDFVAGIVDIAQRGRSLGIHLILATQRPSGSVNDNILANTNLRISLRMLDRNESSAVIGSSEAASIPVPLKGRGYARLGPRELVSFQSAYCGESLSADDAVAPILISAFDANGGLVRLDALEHNGRNEKGSLTHLQAVLDAVNQANRTLHLPAPRPPWRDVLPESVLLDKSLLDEAAVALGADHPRPVGGLVVTFGLVDDPQRQDQYPAVVDLEDGGGMLVFGSGSSGKTTLLRTIALSAALTIGTEPLAIVGFDFASRALTSLSALPQTIEVATGDDLESVTRLIAFLGDEVARRRLVLAAATAENLTLYNQRRAGDDEVLSRILVLIDSFGGFQTAISGGNVTAASEQWLDRLIQVVLDGRQVGIHSVITADRRNAVPARLYTAIGSRLLLRHADESGYTDHGVSMARAKGLSLSAGRGIWQGEHVVQVAAVALPADGVSQSAALIDAAERTTFSAPLALRSMPLPDRLPIGDVVDAAPGPLVALGRCDLDGSVATVDLTWSNLLIAGPPRAGRSTALEVCAARLGARSEMWVIGSAASPLQRLGLPRAAFGKAERIAPLMDDIVAAAGRDEASPKLLVLLIDDLDAFSDSALNSAWDKLSKLDNLRIVASIESRSISGYTTNPLLTALRSARNMLLLQPVDAAEIIQLTGTRASLRPGLRMPPGRGLLLCNRIPMIVHVAIPNG